MIGKIAHILLIVFCASAMSLKAQKYFVSFTDKANNTYSIDAPLNFLSQRAIDRRARQNIGITEEDLPVTQAYVDSLKKIGLTILWPSKWLNGVIVESNNNVLMDTITQISFVASSKLIYQRQNSPFNIQKYNHPKNQTPSWLKGAEEYGSAWNQVHTINGQYLHNSNYMGKDKIIAILDDGFGKVNTLPSFTHLWDNQQILSSRDIVKPSSNFFELNYSHGTKVLSIMGGVIDNEFKGSAPKASYHLIRTEDSSNEYPVEEYNWVVGAEYADSVGADIINSSLGYYTFDNGFSGYSQADLNGKTTVVVKGAETAFSKGMIVVASAGNLGSFEWEKIISPADGANVLAVGAINTDSIRASFSSFGPSADGRTKSDVSALGERVALQNNSGQISIGNGTSFSAPVVAGFVACLWQALPELTNTELLKVVKESCNNYNNPNNSLGYGIPNFKIALGVDDAVSKVNLKKIKVFPNPFHNQIKISSTNSNTIQQITIYNLTGEEVYRHSGSISIPWQIKEVEQWPAGIYILKLKINQKEMAIKLIKKSS